MLDRLVRFVYYSLFFITPLLVNSATSELFEFNKMIFIYLSAVLVLSLWSLKIVKEKKIILRKTVLDLPIGIFLFSQLLSTLFSIDRQTSLLGYYGRFNGGLLSIFSYIVLFYGFVTFIGKEHVKKLLKISLFSSFLVILWGLPGKIGFDLSCLVFTGQFNNSCWTEQFRPSERMFSTLGQPNWLGAYLVINFFIALYFFIESKIDKTATQFYLNITIPAYLFLNISAVLFTRSRSSFLALGVGVVIFFTGFLLLKVKKLKKEVFLKKIIFPIASLIIVSILLFQTGIPAIDKFLRIKNDIEKTSSGPSKNIVSKNSSDVTESLDIRKIVWKGAWELGLRYPLFGTGVETFAYSYYLVRPVEHNLTSEWDYLYNKAHNEFLNYLATTGFIGLGAYLVLILFFLTLLIKKLMRGKDGDSLLFLGLGCSWISILVTNFFGFSTTTINLFFFLIPGFLLLETSVKKSKDASLFSKEFHFPRKISYLTVGFLSFFMLSWLALYYVADINYASASAYSQAGDFQKSSDLYSLALLLHREHVYEDKLSYALANLAFLASYQKEQDVAKKLIRQSEFHNSQTLKDSPQNPLYWKTKGKNNYLFYQIELDEEYLKKAIEALFTNQKLAPTDPKIPYTISIFYSLLADEEEDASFREDYENQALYYVNQSTVLKPDFRDGYYLQAQLQRKYGNNEKALEILKNILQINPEDLEVREEILDLSK